MNYWWLVYGIVLCILYIYKVSIPDYTLGFFYLLPFNKNITVSKIKTISTNYYSENTFGFDVSYYIQIIYAYKFNKGKSVKKMNRKDESESDIKTQGIGR